MAGKRFQVFISSTYLDLKSERERVLRTLAECNYIAAGMEFFPAIDEEQFNFIKTVIDDFDYYVAIIGAKYGTVASDGYSYSEKEYDYAVQNAIPVIALLRENISSLDAEKLESEVSKRDMLERFRARLSTGRLVSYWNDETELCYRLINSLATTARKYPRDGWVRGGKETREELLTKIITLEEEIKTLQKHILDQQQIPLADRISKLLNDEIEVKYETKLESSEETRADVVILRSMDIARFVIPRLGSVTGETKFSDIISDLVRITTENSALSIDPASLRAIQSSFSGFGLINVTVNGLGHILFIRTELGESVVGAEAIKAFESQKLQQHLKNRDFRQSVTALQVLEDIGFLLSKNLTNLIAYVMRKWRRDRQTPVDT